MISECLRDSHHDLALIVDLLQGFLFILLLIEVYLWKLSECLSGGNFYFITMNQAKLKYSTHFNRFVEHQLVNKFKD